MSKYDEFKKKIMEEKNVNLTKIGLGNMSIVEAVAFFTNCLVFPAIYFQSHKTFVTQEAQDVDFKMGDEESEDDDDKPTEGMLASALTRLKAEDDKPISVPGMDEEVAEVEEEEQQPSGLMARRA